jgi:uncharacterized DUF497 family protein
MAFEFDPAKSAANKDKHGIDFEEAQAVWSDPAAIEADAAIGSEPRFIVIGRIVGRHWAAICTRRGDNIRIISVRRARKEEIKRYDRARDHIG